MRKRWAIFVGSACLTSLWAAASARATEIALDFTANFPGGPIPAVTGEFTYDAPSLTSPITALTSVSLTIGDHAYTLSELTVSYAFDSEVQYIGTVPVGTVVPSENKFYLDWQSFTPHGPELVFSSSSISAIESTSDFTSFTIAAVPEPPGWGLLLTGFAALAALPGLRRRRLGLAAA
jgi:hypothetical protein